MKKNTNKWLLRLVAFPVIAAVMLAAAPAAVAGPHGPGPRHGPPAPMHHHHHHHGGDFLAGVAIAGLTYGVIDTVARLAEPPPPPPPPASTVVYSTPCSTVTYSTYTPAPVVYAPLPPPPPPPPRRWRYGY